MAPIVMDVTQTTTTENLAALAFPAPSSFDTLTLLNSSYRLSILKHKVEEKDAKCNHCIPSIYIHAAKIKWKSWGY